MWEKYRSHGAYSWDHRAVLHGRSRHTFGPAIVASQEDTIGGVSSKETYVL